MRREEGIGGEGERYPAILNILNAVLRALGESLSQGSALQTAAKPEFAFGRLICVLEVAEGKTFPSHGCPGLGGFCSR